MKKIYCLLTLGFLISCVHSSSNDESINLVAGTIDTKYLETEIPYFGGAEIEYKHDGKIDTIKNSDEISFAGLDTSVIGPQSLSISYKNFTTSVSVEVLEIIEGENCQVIEFSKPSSIVDYEENLKANSLFLDKTPEYFVGDDNPYLFRPLIRIQKLVGEFYEAGTYTSLSLPNFEPDVSLFIKSLENETYTELTETEKALYLTYDLAKGSYDFNENAISKTFKIVVETSTKENIATKKIEHIIKIVDGYNVTKLKELSYFDNTTIWNEYKTANELDIDYHPTNVILHGNFNLKIEDIPNGFKDLRDNPVSLLNFPNFIPSDAEKFVVREFPALYTHVTEENGVIGLLGNYYQVDFSKLPLITREEVEDSPITEGGGFIPAKLHAFAFVDHNLNAPYYTVAGTATIRNLKIKGNTQRDERNTLSGGLSGVALASQTNNVHNLVVTNTRWSIAIKAHVTDQVTNIDNLKSYDTYHVGIYTWNAGEININHSQIQKTGGPSIVVADTVRELADKPINCSLKIDAYTFENTVSAMEGTEAWFQGENATSIATNIKPLGQRLYVQSGANKSSFLDMKNGGATFVPKIVLMPGALDSDYAPRISLYINNELVINQEVFANTLQPFLSQKAPIFQTNGRAPVNAIPGLPLYPTSLFDGANFVDILPVITQTGSFAAPEEAFYHGDWISMSSDFIGSGSMLTVIFDYFVG
jgi:hypothetical protein